MIIFLPGVKKEDLDQELLVKLDQASSIAQLDFTVTSGYRPGVDGVDNGIKNGPHMSHKAADLRCNDSTTRYKMFYAIFKAGFKRVGVNSVHIHVDTCTIADSKPENVFWIEPEPK